MEITNFRIEINPKSFAPEIKMNLCLLVDSVRHYQTDMTRSELATLIGTDLLDYIEGHLNKGALTHLRSGTTSTIVPGYQLHVTTWENDNDAIGTKIINGLTEFDVLFYLDLALRFTCSNYGNQSVSKETLQQVIKDELDTHPHISDEVRKKWSNVDSHGWQTLCETILGYPVDEHYSSKQYFCRAFDDFKVYQIPVAIEEVTHIFDI